MSDPESTARQFFQMDITWGLGAHFMALVTDVLLAGVIVCQCTHWVPMMKNDQLHIRIIVSFGALSALATSVYTIHNYFNSFVTNFGFFSRFASFDVLGWYALCDILTVVSVQLVFGERSIRINNFNPFVIAVDVILVLLTIAASFTVLALSRGRTLFDAPYGLHITLLVWPSVCTSAHLAITASILWGLIKTRQGSKKVNRLVDRIIYMSLESQVPATAFAIATVTVAAVNPTHPIGPWIMITHPKVFMVGCLAMINSRHSWQKSGIIPSGLQSDLTIHSSLPQSYPSAQSWSSAGALATPKFHSGDLAVMGKHSDKDLAIEYMETGMHPAQSEEVVNLPLQDFDPPARGLPSRTSRGLSGEFGASKDSLVEPTLAESARRD